MATNRQDLDRLDDLARLQRLREAAAAARLAVAREGERQAEAHLAAARQDAALTDAEFRRFMAAGQFQPGQFQMFGALLTDHARLVGEAAEALAVARHRTGADQAAHALARLQSRQIAQRLRTQQARHRRKAEDRQAGEHQDLHIILQEGAHA